MRWYTSLERLIRPESLRGDQNTAARRVYLNAWVGIAVTIVYGIGWVLIVPQHWERALLFVAPLVGLYGLVLFLVRKNLPGLGLHLYLAGGWLLITIGTATTGGTRAPAFGIYTLLVMFAALLGRWRLAFFYGFLSLLAGVLMVYLEERGFISSSLATPMSAWLTQAIIMILLSAVVYFIAEDLNQAYQRVQKELEERKRTEDALRESESRYRALFEFFPDVILIQTLSGQIVHMNNAAQRQIGLSLSEINDPHRSAIIHPKDAPLISDAIRDLLKSDKTCTDLIENRFINKSGQTRWYSGIILKTTWEGSPALQIVTRDITDSKMAETRLRENEAMFRTIFELAPYGIIIQRQGGVVTAANQAFVKDSGYSLDQVLGHSLFDLDKIKLFRDPVVIDSIRRELYQTGRVSNYQATVYHADGHPFDLLLSSQRFELEGELCVMTIGVDITRLKQAEADVRALNAELQQQATHLSILNEVSHDIAALQDLRTILRETFRKLTPILPMDVFLVILYNPQTEEVTYPLMYDNGQFWEYEPSTLTRPGMMSRVIDSGETLMLNRTEAEIAEIRARNNRETRVGDVDRVSASILMSPLSVGGGVIGVISVQSYSLNAYTEKHRSLLDDLAYQIAVAVNNARLYDTARKELAEKRMAEEEIRVLNADLREKAAQLTTINNIAHEISALTDLGSTLRRTLAKLKLALPLDVFFVALVNPANEAVTFPIMYDDGQYYDQPTGSLSRAGLTAQVVRTAQPVILNRTEAEMESRQNVSQGTITRLGNTNRLSASILMAPLILGGEVIGVISVQSYTLNAYNTKHVDLLVGVASQVVVAVDNANLYDSLRKELTVRQQAEQDLFQLNAELEHRVAQRTAQLESTNRELEAFSYSVSHDLRSPLRSIDGFSQALLEDYEMTLDAVARGYLMRVRFAAQRMGTMIDALLTLSRITRAHLNLQSVNLSAIVREIVDALREEQPTRSVEVQIAPDVQGMCDPRLMQVALQNLIQNAWKYTSKQESARIEFGCRKIDHETVYHVTDNGVGFDMNYVDKLFTAFQRLHTEQEFQGTGIGLATVQRVIHRHGGRIWAEGSVAQGAAFYFTLMSGEAKA